MSKEFDRTKGYVVGKQAKVPLPGKEISGTVEFFTGEEAHRHNAPTATDLFRKNPWNWKWNSKEFQHVHIYEIGENGVRVYFAEGKFQPRKPKSGGLADQPALPAASGVQPPRNQPQHNTMLPQQQMAIAAQQNNASVIDILKDRLANQDIMIQGLQAKINDMTSDLIFANAAKAKAEEALAQQIVLQQRTIEHEKATETRLLKEYKDDVEAEAKKLAKRSNSSGLGDIGSLLSHPAVIGLLAQWLGPKLGGDAQPQGQPQPPGPQPMVQPQGQPYASPPPQQHGPQGTVIPMGAQR